MNRIFNLACLIISFSMAACGPDPSSFKEATTGQNSSSASSSSNHLGGSSADATVAPNTDNKDTVTDMTKSGSQSSTTDTGQHSKAPVNDGSTSTGINTTDDTPSYQGPIPPKKECTINPAYAPEDIQCKIGVSGNNVWNNTSGWKEAAAQFKDLSANWISSLAGNGYSCPFVPQSKKLIYVSYLRIDSKRDLYFEFIPDDVGTFHVWKDADPSKEVLLFNGGQSHTFRQLSLDAGHYAIVIEASDLFQAATGMVASISDSSGHVLKNTQSDGSWCIFRVDAATNAYDYVPKAGACRTCLMGPQ